MAGPQAQAEVLLTPTSILLTNVPYAPTQSLSEREQRILKNYGKLPFKGRIGQAKKQRTYFDSGDFALSAAHKVTDSGAIQTGTEHPVRETIPHPYVPVPHEIDKSPMKETAKSPLSQDWTEYDFRPASAGPGDD
ncbi:hypothetical protein BDV06DRAFT_221503 [Aspergillus oleicola]